MHVSVVYFVYEFMSGVASKAFLMSTVMSSVLFVFFYFLWLKPSSMFCVICVSKELVECFGLKPCWVGDNRICDVIWFSMSRSITSKAVLCVSMM